MRVFHVAQFFQESVALATIVAFSRLTPRGPFPAISMIWAHIWSSVGS
jgi:hypothetical protein